MQEQSSRVRMRRLGVHRVSRTRLGGVDLLQRNEIPRLILGLELHQIVKVGSDGNGELARYQQRVRGGVACYQAWVLLLELLQVLHNLFFAPEERCAVHERSEACLEAQLALPFWVEEIVPGLG